MRKLNNKIKKGSLMIILFITTFFGSLSVANAQNEMAVLILTVQSIKQDTTKILSTIDQTTAYLQTIWAMAVEWMKGATQVDDPNIIAENQAAFAEVTANNNTTLGAQFDLGKTLTEQALLGKDKTLPFKANQLSFTILTNRPLIRTEDPNTDAKNYIANLAGTHFLFKSARSKWSGDSRVAYETFFNTVSAIRSYDAFVLSGLNKQNEATMPIKVDGVMQNISAKDYLIAQSSSSDWFKNIATEPLRLVLRQMLMYDSQIYVQLSRLVELQREQIAMQAMANTMTVMQSYSSIGEILSQKADREANLPLTPL